MTQLALVIATVFGIGRIPFAPGTFGSIPGILLALWLQHLGVGWGWIELVVIAIVFAVGTWAAGVAERHYQLTDPGPVVIDEVLGMLVTVACMPVNITGAVVGFLVFRAFDIVKPFPARNLERLHGGLGIMADDFAAGVWGQIVMRLLVWMFPAWFIWLT
jgi:phosphatidylglycerophosphatase A